MNNLYIISAFIVASFSVSAQGALTLDSSLAAALRNHPALKESNAAMLEQRVLRGAAFDLDNPAFSIELPPTEYTWSVSQDFDFPLTYAYRHGLAKANATLAEKQTAITLAELKQSVRTAYLELQLTQARLGLVTQQDSLLAAVANASKRRYDAGDIGLLENLNAQNAYQSKHNELLTAQLDVQSAATQLALWTGIPNTGNALVTDSLLPHRTVVDNAPLSQSPWINWAMQSTMVAKRNWQYERSTLLPGFLVGYSEGTAENPSRVELGVTLPVWFWSYGARIKAARYRFEQSEFGLQRVTLEQQGLQQRSAAELQKRVATLRYHEETALPRARVIQDAATRAYQAGEIGYVEFLQNIQTVFDNRLNYLDAVAEYNRTIIQLQTLYGL